MTINIDREKTMRRPRRKSDAFTEAYLDYYPMVFNSIYTRVASLEDTKDMCQEIFTIFFEKLDSIENKRQWLLGTLKNVVMQYYQKKRIKIDNIDDIEFTFVNGAREARVIIKDAIENAECNDVERVILDLIAIHNLSYNDVAKILGFTRRQVEYRYGLIVDRILRYLKTRGIEDIGELL